MGLLTPIQAGMLYESLHARRHGVNVEQLVCHFDDAVPDPALMTQAWSLVAQRHPALRSICEWRELDEPRIVYLNQVDVRLSVDHRPDLPEAVRKERLSQWLAHDRRVGIDVSAGPTWHLGMLIWSERSFTLVWTFHHLFLDAPSTAMLLQQALRGYFGLPEAPSTDLGGLGVPTPAEHAQALAFKRSDPASIDAASGFFRKMFDGVAFPADEGWSKALRPGIAPPQDSDLAASGMGMHSTQVPARTLQLLQQLCRNIDTTLASLTQAAWGLVLSRWTGLPDVVVGAIRSGRFLLPGSEHTVGCLVNTLPVRIAVARGQTLEQFLTSVRETMVGLRPYEHASVSDVRQWCGFNPAVDLLGCTVLFEPRPLQSRFDDPVMKGLRVEMHEQGSSELSLLVYVEDGIDLKLEFDPDRIPSDLARGLLASTCRVLESMAASSPQTPLAALQSLGEEDVATLGRWAVPDQPVESSRACVATLFEQQARMTPDARAVSVAGSDQFLSYAALDLAASALARWLKARGVKPGDFVALCLPRGVRFVTAMLAVMKSGAAWVPVDPGYPVELMDHMVSDSHARLLLTECAVQPAIEAVEMVLLDELEPSLATPQVAVSARDWPHHRPAYVIYTSGSTGQPKGVVIGHDALACHAESVIHSYGLQASDRVLQFSSLSFDVSIEEMVPTLVVGAELVLRHNEAAESVPALLGLVERHRLTVLNLPTAFWHTCVEQMHLTGKVLCESVRLLVVGGEKASRSILGQWRQIQPDLRWINAYGPTEATISCTFHDMPGGAALTNGPDVPIGRPLGHARAVVLAIDGSLCPPGARGELCICGPGLADGYIGLEAATAEKFVSSLTTLDPLLSQWGWDRLYRTGDDARWDDSGRLQFLGRRDREFKIRGFRVDLRSVEHAIEHVPGVAECVVRVDRPGEAQARLLAWVLASPGSALTESGLKDALVTRLAAHMRPAVQLVSSWPKTPGGKIDVQQLPMPVAASTTGVDAQDLPEDVVKMAALFARVLQCDHVGPDDSFFDLGGNSLLVVSLVAFVDREFGQPLAVGTLKAFPTPASLCAALADGHNHAKPQFLVEIQPEGAGIPLYGIHILGHRERFYRPLAARLGSDQPLFGISTGYTHLNENNLTIEQLAGIYLADIQKHRPEGPVALAAVSLSAYVAYELARQLTAAGREVAYVVFFDSAGPEGRPIPKNVMERMIYHCRQLQRRGARYVWERVSARLSTFQPVRRRIGVLAGRQHDAPENRPLDHPADDAFVQSLMRGVELYRPERSSERLAIFYPEDEPFFDLTMAMRTGLGWGPFSTHPVEVLVVPGRHISMLAEPHVGALAQRLSGLLSREQGVPQRL